MTDSEHSDAEASFTENGTFNLSRGQTPLTEGSEGGTRGLGHADCPPWSPLPVNSQSSALCVQISTGTAMPRSPLLRTLQISPPLTPTPP